MLPESWRTRLDLLLFSETEQRVPLGAYQRFFMERMQEFFSWRRRELTSLGFPEGYFITGPKEMVKEVERRLKKGG